MSEMTVSKTGIDIKTTGELNGLAKSIHAAGFAPRGMNERQVASAILMGAELGMNPMQAVRSIAVVNGRPSVWGDGLMALVQSRGLLGSWREQYVGKPYDDGYACEITATRKDSDVTMTREFSVADAKKAGLWGKSGPWSQYPKRMLWNRARAFLIRDLFADCLCGVCVAEESQDIGSVDITPTEPKRIEQIPEDATIEIIEPSAPVQRGDFDRDDYADTDSYLDEPTDEQLAESGELFN